MSSEVPQLMELDILPKKSLTRNLKMLFAAHHFVYKSRDPEAIADVVNLKPSKIKHWMKTYEWAEALAYWGYEPTVGDLNRAEQIWAEMIEKYEHLFPVEYPDAPIGVTDNVGNLDVYQLIHSHLFCVDNLSDDEICERIADECGFDSEPVRYEGQALENCCYFWIYPNYDEGIYSRVFARANVVGDLVVDFGNETCVVCIRHGRLTLTRQVSDDAVNILDKRLLVCL